MTNTHTLPVDLERFVQPVKTLTLEQRSEARKRLEELTKTGLGVERFPQENLAQALANSFYSRISPEFLRMSQVYHSPKNPEFKIRVPKFGVYSLDNPAMNLYFGHEFEEGYFFRVTSPEDFPRILREHLLLSTDFGEDTHSELWCHSPGTSNRYNGLFCPKDKKLPKHLRKKYHWNPHVLSSTFYGFLPEKTKQEIAEAKPLFRNDLFLVAATKPESWAFTKFSPPKLVRDPLILGIIGEKCYLIDHFDTTPIEDYARREFTT